MKFKANKSFLSILSALAGIQLSADAASMPEPIPSSPLPSKAQELAYKRVEGFLSQVGKTPGVMVPMEDVRGWAAFKDWMTDNKNGYLAIWDVEHPTDPKKPSICAYQIKKFADEPVSNASSNTSITVAPGVLATSNPGSSGPALAAEGRSNPQVGFKLRQSFTDVLTIEDPSQADTSSDAKKPDDLKGGLLSYTRDFYSHSDVWAAQAALLVPIIFPGKKPSQKGFYPVTWGFVPSLEIQRESGVNKQTEHDLAPGAKDIDQMAARLGIFAKMNVPTTVFRALTLRGFFTELTDTSFRANVPAAQFEVEPQFTFPALNVGYQTYISLPFEHPLPSTEICKPEDEEQTSLAYLIRFRLRYDGGRVIDAGSQTEPTGNFERIGPIAELRLSPLFSSKLSLSISDQYLCTITGPDDRSNLLVVSAEFKFYENKATQQSVSLKAIYNFGGVDLTEQKVDTFNLGLGATF